jgi:hypothetical protein
MHVGFLENWLTYLNLLAAAALIARLYTQKLAGIYRILVVYLVTGTLEDVLTLVFTADHRAALFIYIVGQAIKVTVAIFVAMELFRLALVQQPALARWGKRAIGYLFSVAAVAVAGFYLKVGPISRMATFQFLVSWFLKFEGTMNWAVLIILALISIFLLWFPVRARRNAAICIAGFMVYSLQRGIGLLLVGLWPPYQMVFDTAMLFMSFICLTAWVVLLSQQGENSSVTTGHRWNPMEAERLAVQLNAINARLGRRGETII